MKPKLVWACVAVITVLPGVYRGEVSAVPVIVNGGEAKWTHEARDPQGSESVVLREDAQSGGLELLVRYPAGHVFAPHFHDSNERIILLEGRLALRSGDTERFPGPGGYAWLPAREVQRLSCVSQTRCEFYVFWDGNPRARPAAAAGK